MIQWPAFASLAVLASVKSASLGLAGCAAVLLVDTVLFGGDAKTIYSEK
jgi:hypothetical protein